VLAGTDPLDPDGFPPTPVPSLSPPGAAFLVAVILAVALAFGRRRLRDPGARG